MGATASSEGTTFPRSGRAGAGPGAGPGAAPRAVKRLLTARATLALAIYIALALLWNQVALAHMDSGCSCILPGDAAQFAWSFGWFPHALLHGLPLLHTQAMWSPSGINLAGATATPLLAFLLAPVTWLWNPIVAYNLAAMAAPVATAFSAYWLCRYVTGTRMTAALTATAATHKTTSPTTRATVATATTAPPTSRAHWASVLGGAAYGFSSFEVMQGTGHLHMVAAFCPPLAVLLTLRLLDRRISARWFVALLTLTLIAQLLISTEVLFTTIVLGIVALALAYATADTATRAAIRQALRPIAFALIATAIIASPYIRDELHASTYSAGAGPLYPTDLLSFFIPEPGTWIGGTALAGVTSHLVTPASETNAYIGPVMIALIAWFLWIRRHTRTARFLAALLLVVVLWILGGHLYIDGHRTIPLPYRLIQGLPGFNQILQGRVALYLALVAGVVLAMALSQPARWPAARWSLGVLAVLMTLPNLVHPYPAYSGHWDNPSFFATDLYRRYITPGETIFPIRWGWLSESSMWQAEDHFYYNVASGYFTTSPLPGWRSPLSSDLWNDTPQPGDAPQLVPLLRSKHVGLVVVEPSELTRWAPILRRAGLRRTATVGGVVLYHLPTRG